MSRRTIAFGSLLLGSLVALAGDLAWSRDDPAPEKGTAGNSRPSRRPFVPTEEYVKQTVEGWTVRVNKRLLEQTSTVGPDALKLLELKLYEIRQAVPPSACKKLQSVTIWLGVDDGNAPCAEYHPSRKWLEENGYNPDKAKCVEIGNASRFIEWSKTQPQMVLHELAHSYHDRILGFDDPAIKGAFRNAVKAGLYDSVLRNTGKMERAYALSDEKEYFAEASEAFFGTNDFYPFVRAELERHDPQLYQVVNDVWMRVPASPRSRR